MAFNLPVQNNFSRIVQPNAWVRPTDWPVITDAPNEVQFLYSDMGNLTCVIRTQFLRNTGSQNLIIDWGDGTSDTITSPGSTATLHQYTLGTGTPCSRGYTTFKIRVYFTGTGSTSLQACRISNSNNATNIVPYILCPVLEIYYGAGTQTLSMSNYYTSSPTTGLSSYMYLEYVKMPDVYTGGILTNTFTGCSALAKVIMPVSAPTLGSCSSAFSGCFKLESIVFPSNATGISTLSNAFFNCVNLKSVVFPTSLNSCTTFTSAFSGCAALKNATIPATNATNFSQIFSTCTSLEWVKFTSLPTFGTVTSVTFATAFNSCFNLQNVYFPDSCSGNANYDFTSTFSGCNNLKSIVFPLNFNPNTLATAFSTCINLKTVVFRSPASRLTVMTSAFSGCINLTNITLPTSTGVVTAANAFQNCVSLETITIDSSISFTNLTSTFNNCSSLKRINWTPGVQPTTSMNNCFYNCSLLEEITMPTSISNCSDISGLFQNCRTLKNIVMPSNMIAVTTAATAFSGCSNLESVSSFPVQMNSVTNFSNLFSSCVSLKSVILPDTPVLTNISNIFSNCYSLESITFGSIQMLNINNMTFAFAGCASLLEIVNSEKLGRTTNLPLVDASSNQYMGGGLNLRFDCPFSSLQLNGTSSTNLTALTGLRLFNTANNQWTASAPQLNVSNTNMSTAALVTLFNDMATQGTVASRTISIANAIGAAGLTTADRQIITTKGWVITG